MRKGIGKSAAVALALVLGPTGLASQEDSATRCTTDTDGMSALGITTLSCERCQFIHDEDGERAVFWTEPVVEGVDSLGPQPNSLREGDVIVAVDGHLITTEEGSRRFSSAASRIRVTLRIRRDGRTRLVSLPVAERCSQALRLYSLFLRGRGLTPDPPDPDPPAAAEAPEASGNPARPPEVSEAPTTAGAPAPPSLPSMIAPPVHLGFGFQCSECSMETFTSSAGEAAAVARWSFPEPPVVMGVERPGAAWSAGLRRHDRLIAIDGVPLTTASGGERFAGLRPGDVIRWTVQRDGSELEIITVAEKRRTEDVVSPPSPQDPEAVAGASPLRFSGRIGPAWVEVHGGPVTVSEEPASGQLIIRAGANVIRIRVPGSGGTGGGPAPLGERELP